MDQPMKLYVEASNLFDEYQKTQFPEGKADELLDLKKKLAYKLKTYNEELKMAADRYFEKASSEIKRGKSNLDGNEEKTRTERPNRFYFMLWFSMVLHGISRGRKISCRETAEFPNYKRSLKLFRRNRAVGAKK